MPGSNCQFLAAGSFLERQLGAWLRGRLRLADVGCAGCRIGVGCLLENSSLNAVEMRVW